MIVHICNNLDVLEVMRLVKIVINIMKIGVPIALIVSCMIRLAKEVSGNEPDIPKALNAMSKNIIAAVLVFLIPTFINIIANLVGSGEVNIASCISNARTDYINTQRVNQATNYYNAYKGSKNDNDYYGALSAINKLNDGKLREDLTTNLNKLKEKYDKEKYGDNHTIYVGHKATLGGFSEETKRIIELHKNDFNYKTFKSRMASFGGYENYLKSLGGIFEKYAGKDKIIPVKNQEDLMYAAEYVWGIMEIWGFDYANNEGGSYRLRDKLGRGDSSAFYPIGVNHLADGGNSVENPYDSYIDDVAAGFTGGGMTTNCGLGPAWLLKKTGLWGKSDHVYKFKDYISSGKAKIILDPSELRAGDIIYFFSKRASDADRRNPDTWWSHDYHHNDIVGYRDDSNGKLYTLDSGHHYIGSSNHIKDWQMIYKIGDYPYPHQNSFPSFTALRFNFF